MNNYNDNYINSIVNESQIKRNEALQRSEIRDKSKMIFSVTNENFSFGKANSLLETISKKSPEKNLPVKRNL